MKRESNLLIFRKIYIFYEQEGAVSDVIFLDSSRISGFSTSYSLPQATQTWLIGPWFSSLQQTFTTFTPILMLVHLTVRWHCIFIRFAHVNLSQWRLSSADRYLYISFLCALARVWRQFHYQDNNIRAELSLFFSSRFKKANLSTSFFFHFLSLSHTHIYTSIQQFKKWLRTND